MKKVRNIVIGGIESKIFNLILITIILVSGAFIVVSMYHADMLSNLTQETGQRQQEAISEITGQVMDQVVEQSLNRTTLLEAQMADDLFHGLGTRVEMLADYAGKLFDDPENIVPADYEGPDPARNGEVMAQLILADGVREADVADRVGIAANMSDMMVSMFGASELTNSLFIALPEGAFLVTDDRSASKFEADGSLTSYDPRTRPWYIQAVEKQGLIFTDVEVDAFTGDIGIVCAMPVYVNGKLKAVVGSDLFLTAMQAGVQASEENGGFLCVVNQNGHVVFSPRTEGLLQVVQAAEAQDLRKADNEALASLVSDGMKENTGVRTVELVDGPYYMIGMPIGTVGWTIISAVSLESAGQPSAMLEERYGQIQEEALQTYRESSGKSGETILVLMVVLAVLIGIGTVVLGKRIVRPLNNITARIAQLREGDLEFKMEDTYRTGDEIEVLAESFAQISHKTVKYVDEVRRVTAEKERIGTELHMANRIQESMVPSIFPAFPDRSEFDIYASMQPAKEVGGDFFDFFLIDDDHLCLVMADVSGKGVPAALFMMISKVIVQSCAKNGGSAAEVLKRTNEALCANNQVQMFVTIWLGILELSTGKLTAANAGHEYPMIKTPDGPFELYKDRHGFVIGAEPDAMYREYELQLQPGSKLFVYTDGVPEATSSDLELFGQARTLDALNQDADAAPKQILRNVKDAVDGFVKDAEQFDDLTMMCVEYKGVGQ